MVACAPAVHSDRTLTPDELIERHLGFARDFMRRLAFRLPASVDLDELESDAFLGLMMAARTFDPARGVQFRTYAAKRICGQMLDGIRGRTACRRRIPIPHFMSMQAAVGSDEGRTVTLGDTLIADTKPVGHEIEALDEVEFVLLRLDPDSREHLTDRHVEGLQQKVLAAKLGITPSAMSERMKRVRILIREIRRRGRR